MSFAASNVCQLYHFMANLAWQWDCCEFSETGNTTLVAELQVLRNKAARLILDLPSRTSSSDGLGRHVENVYSAGGRSTALFLLRSILVTFVCIRVNFCLILVFIIIILDPNIRKSSGSRRWAHWTTLNFVVDDWNALDFLLRETPSLWNVFLLEQHCSRIGWSKRHAPLTIIDSTREKQMAGVTIFVRK